jgi:hypothetical protein
MRATFSVTHLLFSQDGICVATGLECDQIYEDTWGTGTVEILSWFSLGSFHWMVFGVAEVWRKISQGNVLVHWQLRDVLGTFARQVMVHLWWMTCLGW